MYGGRVTDDMDRRVLNTYLEEYLGDFIFDSNQRFYFSRSGNDFCIPEAETFEQAMEFIETIPIITQPGVYGLHPNAEITYYNNAAKALWLDIISMATSASGGGGGLNKEEMVLEIVNGIQDKTLPELFDEYNIRKSFNNNISPAQTVLL
jgi:dynein heavy chain